MNYNVPGTPGSFPKTALKPRRRPSVLCDDMVEDCAALLDSIPNIESLFDRKTSEGIQSILDEYLSSDTSSELSSKETHKYNDNTSKKLDRAMQSLMGTGDSGS